MEKTETPVATPTKPLIHVFGSEALATRVMGLGYDVSIVDAAGAEKARAGGLAVVTENNGSLNGDKLAAAAAGAIAEQALGQLASLRADARKTSHDARNAVALLWMNFSTLERALAATPPDQATIKDVLKEVKEETRELVSLLDKLTAAARGEQPPSA